MGAAVDIMRERLMRTGGKSETVESMADARLDAWAEWSRGNGLHVGWPRATVLARLIEQHTAAAQQGAPPVAMPDDIAAVDAVVARLSDLMRGVILAHYLTFAPSEVKARSLHLSRAHFWRLLRRAQRNVYFALLK